ncbi:MAG TPA: hypothetical protein VHC67_06035 [Gaiellaceae bacterium]|nr:hypothetical protein [Gaiellaceae bacterium]
MGFGQHVPGKTLDVAEQHDPDERHDSILVEGDDTDHVMPPQELDPFTPEPGPPPRARRAMIGALLLVIILLVVLYALAR